MTLNHKRKASFGADAQPQDYDYHFGIIVLGMSIGRDQPANSWEVNYRGTTSSQDS